MGITPLMSSSYSRLNIMTVNPDVDLSTKKQEEVLNMKTMKKRAYTTFVLAILVSVAIIAAGCASTTQVNAVQEQADQAMQRANDAMTEAQTANNMVIEKNNEVMSAADRAETAAERAERAAARAEEAAARAEAMAEKAEKIFMQKMETRSLQKAFLKYC